MQRRPARVDETYRMCVPGTHAISVFPPGTRLVVSGYPMLPVDENPYALVIVESIPSEPVEYNVVVPKGAKVNIHEE